jgi:flagellar hook assembly protein FlgD
VRLALPQDAQVHAVIYDVAGRVVQQLHQGPMRTGFRVMNWEGTNALGQRVSSGVYFLRVSFETPAGQREVLTRQLRLMR